MANDSVAPSAGAGRTWQTHWLLVGAAFAAIVPAIVLAEVSVQALTPLRVVLIFAALILAGSADRAAFRKCRPDGETRLELAAVICMASLVPLAAFLAIDKAWDSAPMVLVALIMVSIAGAILVLLPTSLRKVAVSVLILFHFGGIFVAVTMVEPPGQSAPFLAAKAWEYVYRPYLGFMYLNNAYHFYSPEPGPPTLMWSYLTYSDGNSRKSEWVKLPDRDQSPVPLHHGRLLALTESINQNLPGIPDDLFNLKVVRRTDAAARDQIPLHPSIRPGQQYQEPNDYSKLMIDACARHLARAHPHLKDQPEFKLENIQIYRVRHQILQPNEFGAGYSPVDKTLYHAYFLGKFDSKGTKMTSPDDPYLYWLLPIYYKAMPLDPRDADANLDNCLERHARINK